MSLAATYKKLDKAKSDLAEARIALSRANVYSEQIKAGNKIQRLLDKIQHIELIITRMETEMAEKRELRQSLKRERENALQEIREMKARIRAKDKAKKHEAMAKQREEYKQMRSIQKAAKLLESQQVKQVSAIYSWLS
jgi:hypothetical protein